MAKEGIYQTSNYFKKIDLFQWGKFTSHAGLELNWKIECDAISEKEWDCLAAMIFQYEKRPFYKAIGIPRGGIPLANALNKFATGDKSHQTIICDDIWTTGTSFRDYIKEHYPNWLMAQGIKWVVFARKMTNDGTNALFTMP